MAIFNSYIKLPEGNHVLEKSLVQRSYDSLFWTFSWIGDFLSEKSLVLGNDESLGLNAAPLNLKSYLVGGLEHFSRYWEQSSQLTNIFRRGWNHQPVPVIFNHISRSMILAVQGFCPMQISKSIVFASRGFPKDWTWSPINFNSISPKTHPKDPKNRSNKSTHQKIHEHPPKGLTTTYDHPQMLHVSNNLQNLVTIRPNAAKSSSTMEHL